MFGEDWDVLLATLMFQARALECCRVTKLEACALEARCTAMSQFFALGLCRMKVDDSRWNSGLLRGRSSLAGLRAVRLLRLYPRLPHLRASCLKGAIARLG